MHLNLYTPHPVQKAIHASNARFKVACMGRQVGKSTACAQELIQRLWTSERQIYWYCSPIYRQSKIIYRRMRDFVRNPIRDGVIKKNDSELMLTGPRGSMVQCVAGNEFNSLRTETLNGAVIDEVRDQPHELWTQVIRPMLFTTGGFCWFVSTGNGFDWFYDLYNSAKADQSGLWATFKAPSTANPLITQAEVDIARRDMTEAEFKQEIMAEFVSLTQGTAYYSFSEANEALDNPLLLRQAQTSENLPVELYMDFNVRPLAWVMGQFVQGKGHYFFDEIFLSGTRSNTTEAMQEFIARFKLLNIKANPQVVLVGDATGRALKTSSAGQTDYSIIMQALDQEGISFVNMTPDTNPVVKDRVNTLNTRLRAADGTVSLWLNPVKCPNLKRDFQRVSWKEGATAILDQTTDSTLTHISDAVGYGVCVRYPIERNDVGRLVILRR